MQSLLTFLSLRFHLLQDFAFIQETSHIYIDLKISTLIPNWNLEINLICIYIFYRLMSLILSCSKLWWQKSELSPSGWLQTCLYDRAHARKGDSNQSHLWSHQTLLAHRSIWRSTSLLFCLASVKPEQHGGEGGRRSRLFEGVVFCKFTSLAFCVLASAWKVLEDYKLPRQPLQASQFLSFVFPLHTILCVRT